MTPLSHQLSNLIVLHDTSGSHSDGSRAKIDEELEVRNFAHAGNILAQIWIKLVIDGGPVIIEYINSYKLDDNNSNSTDLWTQERHCTHERKSQYLLQITKCTDKHCCRNQNSSLRLILPSDFLPPCPLEQSSTLKIPPLDFQNDKSIIN